MSKLYPVVDAVNAKHQVRMHQQDDVYVFAARKGEQIKKIHVQYFSCFITVRYLHLLCNVAYRINNLKQCDRDYLHATLLFD